MGSELIQIETERVRAKRPEWLKVRMPGGDNYHDLKGIVRGQAEFILSSLATTGAGNGWTSEELTERIFGSISSRGLLRFHDAARQAGVS